MEVVSMHRPQQQAPILPRFLENHATHKYDQGAPYFSRTQTRDGLLFSQIDVIKFRAFPRIGKARPSTPKIYLKPAPPGIEEILKTIFNFKSNNIFFHFSSLYFEGRIYPTPPEYISNCIPLTIFYIIFILQGLRDHNVPCHIPLDQE